MGESELQHWGVKGMKWGVRRYQNKDGSLTPAGRKRYSEDGDGSGGSEDSGKSKATASRPRSASDLSDDELRKAVNRMQMEEQYNGLMAKRFPPEQPGKLDRVKSYISELGTKAVKDIAGRAVDKAIKDMFKEQEVDTATNYLKDLSKMGDKELSRALKRATSENQIQKLIQEMEERRNKRGE